MIVSKHLQASIPSKEDHHLTLRINAFLGMHVLLVRILRTLNHVQLDNTQMSMVLDNARNVLLDLFVEKILFTQIFVLKDTIALNLQLNQLCVLKELLEENLDLKLRRIVQNAYQASIALKMG